MLGAPYRGRLATGSSMHSAECLYFSAKLAENWNSTTCIRLWIFVPAWLMSSLRRRRRSSRSVRFSRVVCLPSMRSKSGVLDQLDISFWICSTLSFDLCSRFSRSWTCCSTSLMYSHTPVNSVQQTASSLLGYFISTAVAEPADPAMHGLQTVAFFSARNDSLFRTITCYLLWNTYCKVLSAPCIDQIKLLVRGRP